MKKKIRTPIRRLYVPNAIYFITCVTQNRKHIFCDNKAITVFKETLRNVKEIHPFQMRAWVFLFDHIHLLIRIFEKSDISQIMHSAERNFTVNYKKEFGIESKLKLWQKGFWDHVIRDDKDYENHFHYLHYNAVRHKYVTRPEAWPHSSFNQYVEMGWYEIGWGHTEPDELKGLDFEYGE